MEMHEIEITINKDGQVEVQVRGVKGKACLDITKPIEDALGGSVVLREMTPEALENPQENDQELNIGQ